MMNTLAKYGMSALLVASIPVNGDMALWGQWGLAGLVVSYTLWRDHARERRMSEALEKHQAWVQQTLLGALERNTVAMEKMVARPCPLESGK
jgi:hypothetical protein